MVAAAAQGSFGCIRKVGASSYVQGLHAAAVWDRGTPRKSGCKEGRANAATSVPAGAFVADDIERLEFVEERSQAQN